MKKWAAILLAAVVLAPSAPAKDDRVLLADFSRKGEFTQYAVKSSSARNSAQAKGGCYSVIFQEGWIAVLASSQRPSYVFDLSPFNTVSLDVRVRNTKQEPDFASVLLEFVHWQDKEVRLMCPVSRAEIPADNKWHRVYVPVASFKVEWTQEQTGDERRICRIAVSVIADSPVSRSIETDVRDFIAWKQNSDSVSVLPLEE